MSVTSDDRLAAQVARELSLPEPGVHFGATLLVATVVASPVLLAGAAGRQSVSLALGVYAAVLVVVWFVGGLLGSALAATPSTRLQGGHLDESSTPDPEESVGSSGAH